MLPAVAELNDRAGLSEAQLSELRAALPELPTLEQVLKWGLRSSPPYELVEVVTQDEYTHDVILRWRDGLHLAFDAT
jgi:hypothetical protein